VNLDTTMAWRRWVLAVSIVAVLVIIGGIMFYGLRQRVSQLGQEERTGTGEPQPQITTPTDVKVQAKMFWLSATSADNLAPATIEIPLASDPSIRAKQLIGALISQVPDPALRTLPADTRLLQLYILPDGTTVADFSDALATETPSGILSEQLAVDSIVSTLAANVPSVRRLKILIHGQEAETLAGHVDLTDFFTVSNAPAVSSIPLQPKSPVIPAGPPGNNFKILNKPATPPSPNAPAPPAAPSPQSAPEKK